MPDGGRLNVETSNVRFTPEDVPKQYGLSPGGYVRITVSDTGSGMSPEVVARAFEPFFTTKPSGRGTGLGLASIYGFVKQSGGNATIYSELGRGTTVNLYLPGHGPGEPRLVSEAAPVAAAGSGEAVLVVEDNAELRALTLERPHLLGCDGIAGSVV